MPLISRRRLVFGAAVFCLLALCALVWRFERPSQRLSSRRPARMERPDGMAPPAFEAFVRACASAQISPHRVTQTIGDHPLSVGYHYQDGVWKWRGENVPYCAATDVGISDLDDARIRKFLHELARQGFAAFWRHEGKWQSGPHIHAIYAQVPMKWQLRNQVSQWARQRRKSGEKPFRWEKKWR